MVERSESKFDVIARELKRLREDHEAEATRFREWVLRFDAEMERLWNELGLRRAGRK